MENKIFIDCKEDLVVRYNGNTYIEDNDWKRGNSFYKNNSFMTENIINMASMIEDIGDIPYVNNIRKYILNEENLYMEEDVSSLDHNNRKILLEYSIYNKETYGVNLKYYVIYDINKNKVTYSTFNIEGIKLNECHGLNTGIMFYNFEEISDLITEFASISSSWTEIIDFKKCKTIRRVFGLDGFF